MLNASPLEDLSAYDILALRNNAVAASSIGDADVMFATMDTSQAEEFQTTARVWHVLSLNLLHPALTRRDEASSNIDLVLPAWDRPSGTNGAAVKAHSKVDLASHLGFGATLPNLPVGSEKAIRAVCTTQV